MSLSMVHWDHNLKTNLTSFEAPTRKGKLINSADRKLHLKSSFIENWPKQQMEQNRLSEKVAELQFHDANHSSILNL